MSRMSPDFTDVRFPMFTSVVLYKSEDKQVAVLLTALGPAARKVYRTFTWSAPDDARKIDKV